MRVLIFNDAYILSSLAKALSYFLLVKELSFKYRPFTQKKQLSILKLFFRIIEGFYWLSLLIIQIYRFQADVVISQYIHYSGIIGAIASKLSNKKFVIQAWGSDLKVGPNSIIDRFLILLIFKFSTGVICVSKDLENIAKSMGAKNTIVIPSALDLPSFNKNKIRKRHGTLITIARLVPLKGISYLIRAVASVKGCSLIIIGDGIERNKLEKLSIDLGISNRVFFTGWINDRYELTNYLYQAELFVLPSLSEGTPRVIIEAMSCGLPIIATNVGGIPEIISNGLNGIIVPHSNEEALAKAITKALKDTEFLIKASIANKKKVKNFELPIIGMRTSKYLRNVVIDG